jgi:hypothetical protein
MQFLLLEYQSRWRFVDVALLSSILPGNDVAVFSVSLKQMMMTVTVTVT